MEDLDAASLEDVDTFFRTYYAPNNAVLTICGDYYEANVRGLVERYFGEIPSGPPVPPIPGRTVLPPTLEAEARETVEQDISLARAYVGYRIPPYGDDAFYPAAVTANVLGLGKASLLYRTLVREQKLAQDVVAFAFPIVVGASMMMLWATARPGVDIHALEERLFEQVAAVRDVDDADIERAIHLIEAKQIADLQRVGERADQLSMYTMLFDDPDRINSELDRIRAVRPAQVREFAETFLTPTNRVVLEYVPRSRR
jgi:predicted Zn-dependent peptidase